MKHKTAKCCEGCRQCRPTGACTSYKKCEKWRSWFRKEWDQIRKAAEAYKEKKEAEVPK